MAAILSHTSPAPHLSTDYRYVTSLKLHHLSRCPKIYRLKCCGLNKESPATKNDNFSVSTQQKDGKEPENVVLKVAWYASELLGIAASALRSPPSDVIDESPELPCDASGVVDRAAVVETIKQDFQRSYFVTGNLTLDAYEEDCEFADPAGSFKGLRRFKRNCTNFGSLIKKSDMKLMKWEDFEDKGIGHWRFSCILSFPWRPILSDNQVEFNS
ncbi:uncharacterized protein LOC104887036 isoform X2 [Beta vulgaris subsp. vulgaris]|uniref:uncharacterized protein LOC104887036 isoform X2 n=1 Tax=Beta vulgaris subsp. vulgaris TaxID=3555 RepID=UPI002037431E|nr:uncharacterized protein LOC104887036 isoform X2 [Beta vulgaris subsp. vulgaris]